MSRVAAVQTVEHPDLLSVCPETGGDEEKCKDKTEFSLLFTVIAAVCQTAI